MIQSAGIGPVLIGCLLVASVNAQELPSSSHDQLFDQAIREYRAALDTPDRDQRLQRFGRAELLFAKIMGGVGAEGAGDNDSQRIRNADLLVNLGNAALGAEHLGTAILAFRRALALDPDHARAAQNLRHARTLLPDWVPSPQQGSFLDNFFAFTGGMSGREQTFYASICFSLAALLVAGSIRSRRSLFRNLALVPGLIWTAFVIMALVQSGDRGNEAVVVVPEAIARAADSAYAPPRFSQPLPSGTEVDIIEQRDDWSHIRLADGRDGWVHSSAMEQIGSKYRP